MKKFSAPTLELAIALAKSEFECSITELEYEVAVYPKKGFLGLFSQEAIIVAQKTQFPKPLQEENAMSEKEEKKEFYSQIEENFFQDKPLQEQAQKEEKSLKHAQPQSQEKSQDVAQKILKELKGLFAKLPYDIAEIKVKIEKEIVSIEFCGNDCGLLIGEKGYRYSAIYHLLSIWIKKEYDMGLRLEVADFLKNKEQRIVAYIEEHYDQIVSRAFFQTRSFDALTASIALRRFREAIPDKYIVIKPISEDESVIVINEFRGK